MKHFWGGRLHGWRDVEVLEPAERDELFAKTVPNAMGDVPREVLRCFD